MINSGPTWPTRQAIPPVSEASRRRPLMPLTGWAVESAAGVRLHYSAAQERLSGSQRKPATAWSIAGSAKSVV